MTLAAGLDPEYIRELFAVFGPVDMRRMFGGAGLYADDQMFGLVAGGLIHLKAGADTIPDFEREGCAPFSYDTKTGKRTITSYWRLPERLYDDPEELAEWARTALKFAKERAAAPKSKSPKSRSWKATAEAAPARRKKSTRKAPA
jgi:DNA transformation protein